MTNDNAVDDSAIEDSAIEGDAIEDSATFEHLREIVRYQGRMVKMSSMVWRGPDGAEFERDFVGHPGAVAVVPILDDGKIVLVKQFRTPLGRETLELPAGVMDKPGELSVEAAARELAEETGYIASDMIDLGVIHTARAGQMSGLLSLWPGGSEQTNARPTASKSSS